MRKLRVNNVKYIISVEDRKKGRDINKIYKNAKIQSSYIDSLCTKNELNRIIEIEGLKAEKRMIQSTDRKIMDVNRQSKIDIEIKKLENSK